MRVSTPTEREIVIEREFDAPRERVFAAFVDPELVPRWWARRIDKTVVDEMDVRPGGRWRFQTSAPDGEHAFRGVYREISPPERLVQTFEYEGMPGHVCVETIEFEDLGGRTRMVNTSLFHLAEERDAMLEAMEPGAAETLDRLEEVLAGN
jgi:uncharacterized protein YndB with AHSA1/START domain